MGWYSMDAARTGSMAGRQNHKRLERASVANRHTRLVLLRSCVCARVSVCHT